MKRDKGLKLLQTIIPSFTRKWNEYGGNMDDSKYGFLYRDETYSEERIRGDWKSRITKELPFEIPADFLEGITVQNDSGEVYTSQMPAYKKAKGYRDIHMRIHTFPPPYEHTYGTLLISAPRWTSETGTVHGGYLGEKVYQDPNYDPRVTGCWNVEVYRIITEDDINSRADWHGWNAGDANPRFTSYSEMIQTACWLCLARIQGPFLLSASEYTSDNMELIRVDKDDNVEFYPFFFKNIQPEFESLFNE